MKLYTERKYAMVTVVVIVESSTHDIYEVHINRIKSSKGPSDTEMTRLIGHSTPSTACLATRPTTNITPIAVRKTTPMNTFFSNQSNKPTKLMKKGRVRVYRG